MDGAVTNIELIILEYKYCSNYFNWVSERQVKNIPRIRVVTYLIRNIKRLYGKQSSGIKNFAM